MVEEHVEALVRRQDRVEAVPRHRLGLVREDAEDDHRAVGDTGESVHGLAGKLARDRRDQGSRDGEDRAAGPNLRLARVAVVEHANAPALETYVADTSTQADRLAERAAERLGQPARSAAHVAAEVARVPHVPEQGCHGRLGDLLRLGQRPVGDRLVDLERLRMQVTEEVGERLVAAMLERAQPDLGVGVTRTGRDQPHVAVGVSFEAQPRARERQACAESERKPERQQLGPRVPDELAAQVDVEHRARDRHHVEAELLDHPAHGRVRRREHVRADAEREIPALLREDAAADAVVSFEHERREIREVRGCRESGDSAADDHDVPFLDHAGPLYSASRAPRSERRR